MVGCSISGYDKNMGMIKYNNTMLEDKNYIVI